MNKFETGKQVKIITLDYHGDKECNQELMRNVSVACPTLKVNDIGTIVGYNLVVLKQQEK